MTGTKGGAGLVLSGGGAKGAYQLGLFRALRELGLDEDITAVAGSSIGALNAILFAAGHPRLARGVWRRLSRRFSPAEAAKMELPLSIDSFSAALSMLTRITGVYGRRRIFACAYDIEALQPAYFELNSRPSWVAAEICAASCALPDVFLPVEIDGRLYCDGGMPPPESGMKNGDKIPAAALRELSLSRVIICYLTPYDRADLSGFAEGTEFIELRPSEPLEDKPHAGTLDFRREALERSENLGYGDAIRLLGELL